VIVDGPNQSLPRTEVPLGGFDRPVAEQELDLFEFSSCGMAPASARAPSYATQTAGSLSKSSFLSGTPLF